MTKAESLLYLTAPTWTLTSMMTMTSSLEPAVLNYSYMDLDKYDDHDQQLGACWFFTAPTWTWTGVSSISGSCEPAKYEYLAALTRA